MPTGQRVGSVWTHVSMCRGRAWSYRTLSSGFPPCSRTAGVHMKLYLAISQPPLSLYAPLVYMGGVLPYLMFLLHTAHIYQTSEHSWVYAAAGCMLLLVLPRALPTLTLFKPDPGHITPTLTPILTPTLTLTLTRCSFFRALAALLSSSAGGLGKFSRVPLKPKAFRACNRPKLRTALGCQRGGEMSASERAFDDFGGLDRSGASREVGHASEPPEN
eukprot:scaffold63451_cov63-Phaeocystis_antarctica.AAC.4